MRIGRILRNGKEEYGLIQNDMWYRQEVTRDDLGLESFFSDKTILSYETDVEINENEIKWLPPVAKPGKILCIGRNYAEHSREQGKELETKPLIFSKFSSSMIGHKEKVEYPSHTENLDYEVELAVIIGKKASKLSNDDNVLDYIFGYTVANDLTARDVQKSEKQWTRGKGFDNSLPIGPAIITTDEISNIENERIWLEVNGETRQESRIENMIFSIHFLIQYISQNITLYPGDILLTGTPEGVGFYMDPKNVLQKGDRINCGVSNIGALNFEIK